MYRCIMVVHVLLRMVVSLVSDALLLDRLFLMLCSQVYLTTLT
jgi:hypothetical protein